MVGFDWNDLPVGREFDCKFLKKVKSPPYVLPPPPRRHYIDKCIIYSLFCRHNFSCTVFWVSSFHLSVNIVVLYQFTVPGHLCISKTSHQKLKREVSRTEKKVQDCDYVFGLSTTFQRRKEWICESRCRQVSVRLHVFVGFFCP